MTSVLVADRVERKGRDLSEDREVTLGGLASDIFPDEAHANNRRAFKYLSRGQPEVKDGLA
jgi:hypothetical protein